MSLVSTLLALLSCGGNAYTDLDVESFSETVRDGAVAVLDVRTADEYAAGHLSGAANADWYAAGFLDSIEAEYPKGTAIAVYCRSGKRSAAAAAVLSKAGYTVYNMLGGYNAWTEAGKPVTTYEVVRFFTPGGKKVDITLIKHASLAIDYSGFSIQADPVSGLSKPTDYAREFPKADLILVTHEHFDHFDKEAIAALGGGEGTTSSIVTNSRCAGMLGLDSFIANGDELTVRDDIRIEAVPAYNITEGHLQFHPKGRDNGYVLTLDGLRIYIAGDTEDIPEMSGLKDIDIAFLPVNQPYTMTVGQCVNAAKTIRPKVLIPYHFSETDITSLPGLLPGIKVLLTDMK